MAAPSWFTAAVAGSDRLRYVFHNPLGEAWAAEIDRTGAITVSGQDVDWETITLAADDVPAELGRHRLGVAQRLVEPDRPAQRAPLAGKWVIGEEERAWWVAILLVASAMRPKATRTSTQA